MPPMSFLKYVTIVPNSMLFVYLPNFYVFVITVYIYTQYALKFLIIVWMAPIFLFR